MWKTLNSKELFKHPRITLVEDEVLLPSGQTTQYLRFAAAQDAVSIIAQNSEGNILVIREYAYPPNAFLYQFPCGAVDAGESLEDAAMRELMEEGGYKPQQLRLLGRYLVNHRRSTAYAYAFLAEELEECSLPQDPEEQITTEWLKPAELNRKIASGEVVNVHLLAPWMLYTSMALHIR